MKNISYVIHRVKCIPVAPWLQISQKPQIIHGISGIPTQYLVQKEKQPYKIQY